jgi:hypothetical protein
MAGLYVANSKRPWCSASSFSLEESATSVLASKSRTTVRLVGRDAIVDFRHPAQARLDVRRQQRTEQRLGRAHHGSGLGKLR